MDALQLLEQKISSLVTAAAELKKHNKQLEQQVAEFSKEKKKLQSEKDTVAGERDQLLKKIDTVEKKALEGNDQINELNQEKAFTKMAVDDLLDRLKSIDSLVEEKQ